MSKRIERFSGVIDKEFLRKRTEEFKAKYPDFPIPKWITFSLLLLDMKCELKLYEARKTKSKYIEVTRPLTGRVKPYKVRFSDHKPAKYLMESDPCDFYVGVSHDNVVTTTYDALKAVRRYLEGEPPPTNDNLHGGTNVLHCGYTLGFI